MDHDSQQRPPRRTQLLGPFVAAERGLDRFVDWLGSLALFQLLEYAGRLTVLVAVIFYFWEAPERRKQAHYQAWQLINSAQGQTGSGGRIEALQDLNNDGVSLDGLAAPNAHLEGISLQRAHLRRADLQGANLSKAKLQGALLSEADLQGANLFVANLYGADLFGADLQSADLIQVDLSFADLSFADLTFADLSFADLTFADLTRAKGLTVDQIKAAKNWEQAYYDESFHAQLGLPPITNHTPQP